MKIAPRNRKRLFLLVSQFSFAKPDAVQDFAVRASKRNLGMHCQTDQSRIGKGRVFGQRMV